MRKASNIIMALAMLFAFAGPAAAAGLYNIAHPSFTHVTGMTSIPVGHADFCVRHAYDCRPHVEIVEAVALTEHRWQELIEVNNAVNAAVQPATDMELFGIEEYWTYAGTHGDCEDFALSKRRELIVRGWPASTLLMTVVRERNGDGHAVLMVRTDRGDLILDNQEGLIRVWTDTPYLYLKRQSQFDAGQWVDIQDSRPQIITASH